MLGANLEPATDLPNASINEPVTEFDNFEGIILAGEEGCGKPQSSEHIRDMLLKRDVGRGVVGAGKR